MFVFPSHADTFGLVMVEAMACGTPVAAYPGGRPADGAGPPARGRRGSLGGAMDADLRQACVAALAVPRSEARERALDFSWAQRAQPVRGLPGACAGSARPAAARPSVTTAVMNAAHTVTVLSSPDLHACATTAPTVLPFLDRDHSILAFNERVLDWAQRDSVPLLERLRYLTIVSSNLDEFFEVRAADHLTAAQAGEHKGPYTVRSFEALAAAAHTAGGAPVRAVQRRR